MWTKTRLLRLLLILACLFSFAPSVGSCSQTYQITEEQLLTLENNLTELEKNNETLKMLLSTSNEDLTQVVELLMKSQSELMTLKTELNKSKQDLMIAQSSLKIANDELQKASESFKRYEKERDKTENRLRTQRNVWEFIAALAVGVAVAR